LYRQVRATVGGERWQSVGKADEWRDQTQNRHRSD